MNKLWYFGGLLTFIIAAVVIIGAVNAADNNLEKNPTLKAPAVNQNCGCGAQAKCGGSCQTGNCQCGSSCVMNQTR